MTKTNLTVEQWRMILGDIAHARDEILQTARPWELRDMESAVIQNAIKRDEIIRVIQSLLEPSDKAPPKNKP